MGKLVKDRVEVPRQPTRPSLELPPEREKDVVGGRIIVESLVAQNVANLGGGGGDNCLGGAVVHGKRRAAWPRAVLVYGFALDLIGVRDRDLSVFGDDLGSLFPHPSAEAGPLLPGAPPF